MEWKNYHIEALLDRALQEDIATGDLTTRLTVDPALQATATILARQNLTVCGLGCISAFLDRFAALHPSEATRFEVVSHPEIFDSVAVRDGQPLAVIRHRAQALLSCERVILNLLQHLSGIATLTRRYADALRGTSARVLDTRKTIPGLRMLEKYAVVCGGGTNHRLDLSDGVLIKNNHIALGGGIRRVLAQSLAARPAGKRIQIEVRSMEELAEALEAGAEAILLDNMTPDQTAACVKRIRRGDGWIPIEASGGIVLENIRAYAEAGVDFISVGALTHSAPAADISMRIAAVN
jgi:nicotinate-nucleotide pyrophosphorylase (carboxylating)